MNEEATKKSWGQRIPDPMVIIFYILIFASVLTIVIPKGAYDTEKYNGRNRVIAGSYHHIENTNQDMTVSKAINKVFDVFVAIPKGLINASQYLFIVFIAGGLFHVMSKSRALENCVGTAVKTIGMERKNLLIWLSTYMYGIFGVTVGFENNIALVPIALLISNALGFSNRVGGCIAVGGIGVGFALSPINPYTVGVSQGIAELPLFSGALLRSVLVFSSLTLLAFYITAVVAKKDSKDPDGEGENVLSKDIDDYSMSKRDISIIAVFGLGILAIAVCSYLAGIKVLGRSWYIKEISAVFLIIAILVGIICRMNPNEFVKYMMEGASKVTAGALIIGLAASIKVVLQDGDVIYTIVHGLNQVLDFVPNQLLAVAISIIQGVINVFIPSGSGQALVTMPILIPLADLLNMSRQLMILAFQVGDGLTNIIIPTSGGTLAMLAMARLSYSEWLKIICPFMVLVYILSWAFILFAGYTGW